MSCNRIFYQNGTKYAIPVVSREDYLELRNSSSNIANLQKARSGDKKAKMKLLQINYSGHYPNGTIKGCRLPSKAFVFDIDSVEDFERVAPILLADPEKYGLLMLEHSVSQGGHAVLRRQSGRTILESQVALATQLQCEMDTNTHDINRVLFTTSADENDLLYLSDELFNDIYEEESVDAEANLLLSRESNGEEELPEGAHSTNKHFRPWEASPLTVNHLPLANSDQQTASSEQLANSEDVSDFYLGIPYSDLVTTYWEMYNNGKEPTKGDRDSLTYELAYMFRNICGFDRAQLNHIIPCYDGFEPAEKLKCIDSALQARRTAMPRKMRDLIDKVRTIHTQDADLLARLDEAQMKDDTFYADQLPNNLPMGLKDSVDSVGPNLAMASLLSSFPAIGALATGVKLDIHGTVNTLNLITYVAGDFASGKGSLDPVVNAWMREIKDTDNLYLMQEQEYRMKKKAAANKKEQPEEPHLPVRCLTLNNTVANLAERLANTEEKHAFSFTPEADTLATKWKNAMSDFSVMLRQSYDASAYEREAKSVDAVNVHIERLLWNVVMCGTPDALYRVVSNFTDGFASRIAIARTPDNTFQPLMEKPYHLTPLQAERIEHVAHLLPLMNGTMTLEKVEEKGREWLERIRVEAMKDDDRVKARLRMRTCVTAQRMVGCVILCSVADKLIREHGVAGAERQLKSSTYLWKEMAEKAQTPSVLKCFDIFADYLLDNAMMFFHDRIEAAMNSETYGVRSEAVYNTKNKSIFDRLDINFTNDQAYQHSVAVKGSQVTRNCVRQMLKNWKKQGLVVMISPGNWRKTGR